MKQSVLLFVFACGLVSSPASAREVALIDLIEPNAGLIVHADGLAFQIDSFARSPLFERFQQSRLYARWDQSKEKRQLLTVSEQVEAVMGQPVARLFADTLGTECALVIFPPTDSTSEPSAILLTRIGDRATTERLLDLISRADKSNRAMQEHQGVDYWSTKEESGKTTFHVIVGDFLALSENEAALRTAIDRYQHRAQMPVAVDLGDGDSGNSRVADAGTLDEAGWLSESPTYQRARDTISPACKVFAMFNPRAWDGIVLFDRDRSVEERMIAAIWSGCEWIAAGLRMTPDPRVEVAVEFPGLQTSQTWSRVLAATSTSDNVIERVPADAVAVVSGSTDFATMAQLIRRVGTLSPDVDRILKFVSGLATGKRRIHDILASFDNSWCGYVVASEDESLIGNAFGGLLAFQLGTELKAATPTGEAMRAALDSGLNTLLNFIAAAWMNKHAGRFAYVTEFEQNSVRLRHVAGHPLLRPTYTITGNQLILATSPELILQYLAGEGDRLADSAAFTQLRSHELANASQLLVVRTDRIRNVLNRLIARSGPLTDADAGQPQRQLGVLSDVAGLVDTVYVAIKLESQTIRVVGGVSGDPMETSE